MRHNVTYVSQHIACNMNGDLQLKNIEALCIYVVWTLVLFPFLYYKY